MRPDFLKMSMLPIRKLIFISVPVIFWGVGFAQDQKPNVVFIIVDDLRTALGCYGDSIAKTPNIDALAKTGTVFQNAYCQQAVCNASRASFISGKRPNAIKVWDLKTHFRTTTPDIITLPQYFKQNGYHTQSAGKIFHDPAEMQDPASWSVPETFAETTTLGKYVLDSNLNKKGNWKSASTERADRPESVYIDGMVSDAAIKIIDTIKNKPFFLAVGFRRPHLPFSAPEKYWRLYDDVSFPIADKRTTGIPGIALENGVELNGYTDIQDSSSLSYEHAQLLLRGYYAATSFVDYQIGKLIKKLEKEKLLDKTIIVLLSDHGFHLGEKNLWCKATNFEEATRVPLIIAAPGLKQRGVVSTKLVELLDVYPTLVDFSGLSVPPFLDGKSLLPLLNDARAEWYNVAFSQFPRPWPYKKNPDVMGYSVRTKNFRYSEWKKISSDEIVSSELYDLRKDPYEMNNVVGKAGYREDVRSLRMLLQPIKNQ